MFQENNRSNEKSNQDNPERTYPHSHDINRQALKGGQIAVCIKGRTNGSVY